MYLDVLDAVANCKEIMMGLLHTLKRFFQKYEMASPRRSCKSVKSLVFEHGEELKWLIPYPGDFHLLMNYQKAMTKPYCDGLKAMAQAAG